MNSTVLLLNLDIVRYITILMTIGMNMIRNYWSETQL